MGLSGISPLSLLLILAIIFAFFGTSKLKALGSDLGEAIKNFRRAMNDDRVNDSKNDDHKPS
ncbi:hypothetical protein TUM19329_34340 [Legionella antarctica]|uniref:Sec-independent protein translocase protein TatA n=1 Tax=Legionella antarctica TaxID=2708020 RepID=A0A6F8TA02_9GAMM|nr:twin-arginine translocase TatA/TatE family subunit [Legionella antarctica]BCA97073.1 hypothetical protein TUM19329_34340 [Legionella antarctica]